ncbi:MAG TPA: hypothetical protein PLC48_14850 [Ferruginibacter sp.]|nr:hypothetical protein [Ferruginibacter sp.]
MKRSSKKMFLLIILVGAMIITGIGYYLYNKGPEDVKNSKGLAVLAKDLYESFLKDTVTASKKYSGKVLEIDGEITGTSMNTQNQQVILVKTNTAEAHVNCTLDEAGEKIPDGKTLIKLKGICSGLGQGDADLGIPGDVYLTRCYILK